MALRHLRYFVAVTEEESITDAGLVEQNDHTLRRGGIEADAVGLDARRRRGLVSMDHHGRAPVT
jgi:hypothetical protein